MKRWSLLSLLLLAFSASAFGQTKLDLLETFSVSGTLEESRFFFPREAQFNLTVHKDALEDEFGRLREVAEFDLTYGGQQFLNCRGVVTVFENEDEMGERIKSALIIYPESDEGQVCPSNLQVDIGEFGPESDSVYIEINVYEPNGDMDQRLFSGVVSRN